MVVPHERATGVAEMRRVLLVVACVVGMLGVAAGAGAAAAPVATVAGPVGGLSATTIPDRLWSQGSPNVEGTPNSDDDSGYAVAS
jgi:hypothetical protein